MIDPLKTALNAFRLQAYIEVRDDMNRRIEELRAEMEGAQGFNAGMTTALEEPVTPVGKTRRREHSAEHKQKISEAQKDRWRGKKINSEAPMSLSSLKGLVRRELDEKQAARMAAAQTSASEVAGTE